MQRFAWMKFLDVEPAIDPSPYKSEQRRKYQRKHQGNPCTHHQRAVVWQRLEHSLGSGKTSQIKPDDHHRCDEVGEHTLRHQPQIGWIMGDNNETSQCNG